jgi:hypothetical protein
MGTSWKRSSQIRGEGPSWEDVEVVLRRLAQTGELLPSLISAGSHVASYHPGRRVMLTSQRGSQWIAVEDIRTCWDTFERLRRIRRRDVLEPGRCSEFMVAVFTQVPGVVEEIGDADRYLVLPA